MLPKMRYRLGLDLGTNSIGWCLLRLNQEDTPCAVIKMGVRIFSDGRNPKDHTSLAVGRRLARQMRRRRDRLLKRKSRLTNELIKHGFFPADLLARKELVDLDPYQLRQEGLNKALTGPEFARALFHLNQRRGFLSNRRTDKRDNEGGLLKKAIGELQQKLGEVNARTLGEWLAIRHRTGMSVRARLRGSTQKDKAYDFYADRSMIAHEFDTLWKTQEQFNPALFNETARAELRDTLLFQRSLRPVEPGRCTLIPEEPRAPLALPSTQRFRIYQEVNNLRVTSNLEEKPLTLAQRDIVVSLLENGDATFSKVIKSLGLPGATTFNLQDEKRDRLKGNATSAICAKADFFGSQWASFSHQLQDEIIENVVNEPSEAKLTARLVAHAGVEEPTAIRIANARFPEGYGSLSKPALSKILPELIKDVIHILRLCNELDSTPIALYQRAAVRAKS